jgi:uncharacterized protein (TIGR02246 family)
MKDDERALRGVHEAWIDAVNAGNLERLLELMAEDAVLLNPGQAPTGRAELSANFPAAHERFRIRCVSELDEVVVAGELAYVRCTDRLELEPRAGGVLERLAGHRLTIYRRRGDGRWLLERDMHTLLPVAS